MVRDYDGGQGVGGTGDLRTHAHASTHARTHARMHEHADRACRVKNLIPRPQTQAREQLKVAIVTTTGADLRGVRRELLPWMQYHTALGVTQFYVRPGDHLGSKGGALALFWGGGAGKDMPRIFRAGGWDSWSPAPWHACMHGSALRGSRPACRCPSHPSWASGERAVRPTSKGLPSLATRAQSPLPHLLPALIPGPPSCRSCTTGMTKQQWMLWSA